MLKNNIINLKVVSKIAKQLGKLNEQVVFVGGAVVSLYINDSAADEVRPTKDIDFFLEIVGLSELEKLRIELTQKGFYQTAEDDVNCRFRYEDIKVDVMATKEVGWAPANPWFEAGLKYKTKVHIEKQQLSILPLPYFLATKFAAYHNRGNKDPRTSHDFEDIIYILDNQTDIVDIIRTSPEEVRQYLMAEFKEILDHQLMKEAIRANLFYETQEERFKTIVQKLKAVID